MLIYIVCKPFFIEGKMGWKSQKIGQEEGVNFIKPHGEGSRTMQNLYGRWDFSILIYSLLAFIVIDTAFRKSNLENLLLKVVVLGTSKHWSYNTGHLSDSKYLN